MGLFSPSYQIFQLVPEIFQSCNLEKMPSIFFYVQQLKFFLVYKYKLTSTIFWANETPGLIFETGFDSQVFLKKKSWSSDEMST